MSSAGTAYVDIEAKLDSLASDVDAAISAIDTQTIDIEAVADTSTAQEEIDGIEGGSTEITVQADTEQAQASVDELSGSVGGLMDSLGGGGGPGEALGGFAESAGLVGLSSMSAATGGLAALGLGLGYASSEAMDAQTVLAQLDQMVENAGANAGVTSGGLQAMATQIQQTAGFSDEAVMSGEAMVLMFENVRNVAGSPIFDRTIKASADLARSPAFNGDITNAARTLGRALDDPTAGMGRLRRAGIQLTEAQQENIRSLQESGQLEEAQAALLDVVEGKVQGLAQAYGDTLAGSLDKTKEKLGENAEQIGGVVLPAVNALVGGFADLADSAYDLGYAIGEGWQGRGMQGPEQFIQGIGTVVGELPPAFLDAADAADDLASSADDAGYSVGNLDDRVQGYLDGLFSIPEAQRQLRESFTLLTETLDDPARTADDVAVSLQDIVTNAALVGTATGDMTGAVDSAVFGLLALQNQGKLSAGQVAEVKSQLESLPGNTEPGLSIPNAPTARSQAQAVGDALLGIPDHTTAYVGVSVNRAGFDQLVRDLEASEVRRFQMQVSVNAPPARASGGPVSGGESYLVGEQGPEMFVPRHSGSIIPAPQTSALVGGGGVHVGQITIHAPGGNGDDIARAVTDAIRKLERAGR